MECGVQQQDKARATMAGRVNDWEGVEVRTGPRREVVQMISPGGYPPRVKKFKNEPEKLFRINKTMEKRT